MIDPKTCFVNESLCTRYVDLVTDDTALGCTRACYSEIRDALIRDAGRTITRSLGRWMPCELADPYEDFEDLNRAARHSRNGGLPVFVSDTEHNGAFLGDESANLLFRAHHDAMHVEVMKGFGFMDEVEVCAATIRRLGIGKRSAALLTAEIVGQGLYFDRFGRFPLHNGKQPAPTPTDDLVQWARDCFSELLNDTNVL